MSWFWLALGAAILWGLGYTLNQQTLRYFSPLELLLFESLLIFLTFSLYFAWQGDLNLFVKKLAQPKQSGLIIFSSCVYVIANLLILNSIAASNAAIAAIIESCYPLFTVFFNFVLFGQLQLNLASSCGFILIFAGIFLVKFYA